MTEQSIPEMAGSTSRNWRTGLIIRPEEAEALQDTPSDEATFDELIDEITLLDETYQQRELTVEEYQTQRQELMQMAKRLSEIEVMK